MPLLAAEDGKRAQSADQQQKHARKHSESQQQTALAGKQQSQTDPKILTNHRNPFWTLVNISRNRFVKKWSKKSRTVYSEAMFRIASLWSKMTKLTGF